MRWPKNRWAEARGAADQPFASTEEESVACEHTNQAKLLIRGFSLKHRLVSVIKKVISQIFIIIIAILFIFLYDSTFRGHFIRHTINGPFSFDCGNYANFAKDKVDVFRTTYSLILKKHFMTVLLYPRINRLLIKYLPGKKPPILLCSVLSGLMIALFGSWLYWRTDRALITFPIILLFGFSFMTWYVGSIWEGKACTSLGVVILLIALDRLLRKPDFLGLLLAIEATVILWLINYGSMDILPLIPFALLTRWRKIGTEKLLTWSVFSLFSVVLIYAFVYNNCGNPELKIRKMVEWTKGRKSYARCSTKRLKAQNFRMVGLQSLVYSVGGLELPAGSDKNLRSGVKQRAPDEWAKNKEAYLAYFKSLPGSYFAVGYFGLIFICLTAFFSKNLWFKEPLLMVLIVWIFLRAASVVYYYPPAASAYSYYSVPLLWAFFAIILKNLNRKKIFVYLVVFLLILVWNNWFVIRFFKSYY